MENTNNEELIIYVDMDGVLVRYERAAYTGDNPQYCRPGYHYFRKLQPDAKMVAVLEKLNNDSKCKVRILTSVSRIGSLFLEQANDKIEWLHEYCPFIDTETQFIACASGKRQLAESIAKSGGNTVFRDFGINHILIDDWNANLTDWKSAGGTAIKYCNSLNNANSFDGIALDLEMSSDDIVELITTHINYLARKRID